MFTEMVFKASDVLSRFQEYFIGVNLTICPNGQVVTYRYMDRKADANVNFTKSINGTWLADVYIPSHVSNAARLAEFVLYGGSYAPNQKRAIRHEYNYWCHTTVESHEELEQILERYIEKAVPECIVG